MPESTKCRNCGAELKGSFCHECGQSALVVRRPAWDLMHDVLGGLLQWDSRLLHTLRLLLFHPGGLSKEWVDGKRARYVPPFRLYIVASFILFLIVGMVARGVDLEKPEITINDASAAELQSSIEEAKADEDWASSHFLEAGQKAFEDPEAFMSKTVNSLPKAAFLLLPVFALLHMGTNFRQKRFYIDYLVFSLHFHAFAFLVISLVILIGILSKPVGGFAECLYFLIPVYAFVAFMKFNQQSWLKSLLKTLVVVGAYGVCLIFGIFAFFGIILFL